MSGEEIFGCIVGIIIFIIIFAMGTYEVVDAIKMKIYKKKYPELFKLIEEREELMDKSCEFHNENITPLLRKIDFIMSEQKYMSREMLKKSNEELEEIKCKLAEFKQTHSEFTKKEDELHTQIENVIRSDKKFLKYMENRGWCREEQK